jgi:translation initiation factor IF-1
MVKNTTGGSKNKSVARKNVTQAHVSRDPEPSDESEFIAKVEKMLGNGMCHVIDIIDKKQYLCYIRGKFRGRQKSHNMVSTNTFVLVGKRPWQSDKKMECDLLCILQQKYGDITESNDAGVSDNIIFTNKSEIVEEVIQRERETVDVKDEELDFDDI